MDSNVEFLNAYNRLDNYLNSIVKVPPHTNLISYLERILPEKQRSECKTVREYKNVIESHGVVPGDEKPIVPKEWIKWLNNMLSYCKKNREIIAKKIQSDYDRSKDHTESRRSGSRDNSNRRQTNESRGRSTHSREEKPTPSRDYTTHVPQAYIDRDSSRRTLEREMNSKLAKIQTYVSSAREWEKIERQAERYFDELSYATTESEVRRVGRSFQSFCDSITKSGIDNWELEKKRAEAISGIENERDSKCYVCRMRFWKMREKKITKLAKKYIDKINSSSSLAEIRSFVDKVSEKIRMICPYDL